MKQEQPPAIKQDTTQPEPDLIVWDNVRDLCGHVYIVTGSVTSGGRMVATQVRCSKCLKAIDLEQLMWTDANE